MEIPPKIKIYLHIKPSPVRDVFKFKVLKQYRGLWMPKGVSKEAVKYWMGVLDKVRKDKDFVGYVTKNNLTPLWNTRGDLAKMLKGEFDVAMSGTDAMLIIWMAT